MKKILLLLIVILAAAQWWLKDQSIQVASNDTSFDYIVKYTGDAKKQATLPLLVALHGNSDTPVNFYHTALDLLTVPARIILIEGPVARARGTAWPWVAAEFSQYGKAFSEAVAALVLKYPTRGKPILLGFSGGSMMAYYQALKHGDNYSVIFPVSGQLSQEMLGEGALSIGAKVFAYHGNADSIIPISGAKTAIALLQENGVMAELTEFKGDHHGIFTHMKTQINKVVEQALTN